MSEVASSSELGGELKSDGVSQNRNANNIKVIINMHSNSSFQQQFYGAGTIWSFWDGNPPDLVLRCIDSMRQMNPLRPVVVLNTASLDLFLDPEDFPEFEGRAGRPEDFSSPQYLADWVRITLLEKYGGVWFDASVICTET